MRTNIKVTGFEELLTELGVAQSQMLDVMLDTLEDAGLKTQEFAIRGIQTGPATGIIYEKYNPRRTHQASRFGEFPMSDTGHLASNIFVEGFGTPVVSVGTNVRYGRYLEFGTSEMSHRQWLTPAFEQALGGIAKDAKNNFNIKFGVK